MKGVLKVLIRKAPKISGKQAVSELVKVNIGNVEQWIYIRGENRNKPILLMLHGGPGTGQIGFIRNFQQNLEQHFVVVQWDQRGAGLSYSTNIPLNSMSIDQLVNDTIEITHYILKLFKRKELYVVGHSWGTILGMLAVSRAPHLYKRYFGISQIANVKTSEKLSYIHVLEKAKQDNNQKAYIELSGIGPPVWNSLKQARIHQKYTEMFGGGITRDRKMVYKIIKGLLFSKEYTILDVVRYFKGLHFSMNCLQAEMMTVDLEHQIKSVDIPIYFLMGKHDLISHFEPAKQFFNKIKAPEKQWVWFENSAHTPILEEEEKFIKKLLQITSLDMI